MKTLLVDILVVLSALFVIFVIFIIKCWNEATKKRKEIEDRMYD